MKREVVEPEFTKRQINLANKAKNDDSTPINRTTKVHNMIIVPANGFSQLRITTCVDELKTRYVTHMC